MGDWFVEWGEHGWSSDWFVGQRAERVCQTHVQGARNRHAQGTGMVSVWNAGK